MATASKVTILANVDITNFHEVFENTSWYNDFLHLPAEEPIGFDKCKRFLMRSTKLNLIAFGNNMDVWKKGTILFKKENLIKDVVVDMIDIDKVRCIVRIGAIWRWR